MTKIALIGRPNVGKSTLFNRLVGKKLAIVDDQPGVTRDLRYGDAKILGQNVTIIDTAGLEEKRDQSLQGRMRKLTERAMDEADILLFLLDARAGVTALDMDLAQMLRKTDKTVILLANKSEGQAASHHLDEFYRLGLGTPVLLSAEHGENIAELFQILLPILEEQASDEPEDEGETAFDPEEAFRRDHQKPIRVVVIGRPNAGKSTLINQILGEERLLTGPEAGITRDSIYFDHQWGDQAFRFYDTAGMRKRAKVVDKVEGLSVSDGIRAMKLAEVVVLLIDAASSLEQQDLRIADLVEREGRGFVLAVNKWDLVENKSAERNVLQEKFERLLPQLRGAPMVFLSAKTGRGIEHLQKAIIDAYEVWNMRIPTAKLNRWLEGEIAHHPPPAPGGRRIKLKYMSQIKARPPSFVIKTTRASEMPKSYKRYLVNGLRLGFELWGTPIRLSFRSDDNPYAKKGKKRQ